MNVCKGSELSAGGTEVLDAIVSIFEVKSECRAGMFEKNDDMCSVFLSCVIICCKLSELLDVV